MRRFRKPPEELEEDYKKQELDALLRGLKHMLGEFDRAG